MRQRNRSLVGTIFIIALTIAYPVAVAILLGGWLASLPAWGSIPLFAVLGALWCLPAGIAIKWMARPD